MFQKDLQRGESKKELARNVCHSSWGDKLCDREFKRNFHLWKKVRNNVKKLFLTVFLQVRFKRKLWEYLCLSTQTSVKDMMSSVSLQQEERAYSNEGNLRNVQGKGPFAEVWAGSRETPGTVQYPRLQQWGAEGARGGSSDPKPEARAAQQELCPPQGGSPQHPYSTSLPSLFLHPLFSLELKPEGEGGLGGHLQGPASGC